MTDCVFPDGFLWGTATSAHQVEGGNDNNDWWDWEAQPGHIHDGSRSGNACGWWEGKAEDDLARAAALGQNAHRMSLEWSRLEPEEGRYDDRAFMRYAQILGELGRLGMKAMVTLHHFTLPRWLAKKGGWTYPAIVERFALFCRECARRLGDRVAMWITLNEPSVHVFMAYMGRAWPPGFGDPLQGRRALCAMLRAHASAYRAIHDVLPGAAVGIALNMPLFDRARPGSPLDRLVAAGQDWIFSGLLLQALSTGWILPPMAIPLERAAGLAGALDFFGLNYYGQYTVRFDPKRAATLFGKHVQRPTVRTAHTDWGQIAPQGLTAQLLRLGKLGVPLYVTENGIYDNSDELRPDFLVNHVRAVHAAIERGAPVRGYFVWSLVDNFEWAEGWSTHFGLIALDRHSQARTARRSAEVYAAICRANGVSEVAAHRPAIA
jgi:beta-glucosidase